jgi:glycosyltransferase involved in cell wall biosynthesis
MQKKKLRIAQVGPLWEEIPPPLYGGTERVISYLTERLVADGHDVTLFACGTSKTSARLVAVYPRPLFRDHIPWTNLMYPLLNITEAFDRADDFDIIHLHLNKASDYLGLPLAQAIRHKVIITLHFPYPTSPARQDRHAVLQKYKDLHYVSISNAQRRGGEHLNWLATVYNGIDLTAYDFQAQPQDYYFWFGKFNPDKGPREAIQAVRQSGGTLILGGTIDTLDEDDRTYYEEVAPLIDGKQIQYVGELDDRQKSHYFGGAVATLNPIQWNEPFGLTMVESMACGTPVIAFAQGAAPEIIVDGETGFLVKDADEMVKRMEEVRRLDRQRCRSHVEQNFTADVMTNGYRDAYDRIVKAQL